VESKTAECEDMRGAAANLGSPASSEAWLEEAGARQPWHPGWGVDDPGRLESSRLLADSRCGIIQRRARECWRVRDVMETGHALSQSALCELQSGLLPLHFMRLHVVYALKLINKVKVAKLISRKLLQHGCLCKESCAVEGSA
jgi:hypothetical protein